MPLEVQLCTLPALGAAANGGPTLDLALASQAGIVVKNCAAYVHPRSRLMSPRKRWRMRRQSVESGSSKSLQDAFVVSEVAVRGKVIDALLVLENRIVVDRYMQCSRPGGICVRCK
jgi:hypothetical protein